MFLKNTQTAKLHTTDIKALAHLPNTIVSCSRDKTLSFFTDDLRLIGRVGMSFGYLTALAVDERYVYVGSEEGVIVVYRRDDIDDYLRDEGEEVVVGDREGKDVDGEEDEVKKGKDGDKVVGKDVEEEVNAKDKKDPKDKNINPKDNNPQNITPKDINLNINIKTPPANTNKQLIPHTYIINHSKNITSLHSDNTILISSSWDNTMTVTDITTHTKIYSYIHPSGVWCVRKDERYIYSACMDGCIRMFRDYAVVRCINMHGGCVRGMVVRGDEVVGVSNDGRVLLFRIGNEGEGVVEEGRAVGEDRAVEENVGDGNVEGKDNHGNGRSNEGNAITNPNLNTNSNLNPNPNLTNPTDLNFSANIVKAARAFGTYCYDVIAVNHIYLFLADDGVVYITDQSLQNVRKTCIGSFCWCVMHKDGLLFFGGANGNVTTLRIEELIEQSTDAMAIEKGVQMATEKGVQNNNDQLQEIKKKMKNNDNYRIEGTTLFQRQGDTWVHVGQVVGKRDNCFTVEIGNRKLELGFDNDENVYDVADRFLRENGLGEEHRDEIVEFMRRNFKKCGMRKFRGVDVDGLRKYAVDEDLVRVLESINEHGVKYNYDVGCVEGDGCVEGIGKDVEGGVNNVNGKDEGKDITNPTITNPNTTNNIHNMSINTLESKLKSLFSDQTDNFYIIDIYRFLSLHPLPLNYSFILTYTPKTRKEMITFVMLVSNLYFCPPFDLEMVHGKICGMMGVVSDGVWSVYEENRRCSIS